MNGKIVCLCVYARVEGEFFTIYFVYKQIEHVAAVQISRDSQNVSGVYSVGVVKRFVPRLKSIFLF